MVSSRGSLGTAHQSDTATPARSRASALDAFSERGGAGQGAGGRPFGGRLVQSGQEGGQGVGSLRAARDGGAVGRLARHPGGDDPGSWKQSGGLAEALRDGNRQRRRGAREGTQVCSLRSVTSADGVAQGKRTARSSPSRQSWFSQPRAPSLTG